MEAKPHSAPAAPSRREFLANLVLGAGLALGLGGLAYRFAQYLYPVIPPVKRVQVFVLKASELAEDAMRTVNLPQGTVMLSKRGTEIRALSSVCTHLGCIVQWHADEKRFICPCHHGIYDIAGKVISGPPPRPLNKLEVLLKGDQIFVVMEVQQKEEEA